MADLSSTKVFGKLTVIHDAILKANAEITGNVNVTGIITGNGSGLTTLNATNLASGTVAEARLPASALIGDTTYTAGAGITLTGTTFALTDESYTTAEKTKLSGVETGATADQTASEILTAIKTVDGTTSGLDADLLDGNHASAFQDTLVSGTNIKTVNSQSVLGSGDITIEAGGAVISDTAPASPSEGKLWWDSSEGNLYVYYNDGSSSQWVISVTPITGPRGPKGNTGDGATLSVGTVTTGDAGTSASVSNSGTVSDAIFDFTIPRGNGIDDNDVWVLTPDGTERFYFATTSHTYVRSAADIIFRNASNSDTMTVDSSGNLTATGDVTAYSDERIKMNIELIPDALDKVNQLNGYTFDRIDSDHRHTGVIAQEVIDILPEAVIGGPTEDDPNAKYSVAYGNMVGLLVEAIKEQQIQIDELKRRLG